MNCSVYCIKEVIDVIIVVDGVVVVGGVDELPQDRRDGYGRLTRKGS